MGSTALRAYNYRRGVRLCEPGAHFADCWGTFEFRSLHYDDIPSTHLYIPQLFSRDQRGFSSELCHGPPWLSHFVRNDDIYLTAGGKECNAKDWSITHGCLETKHRDIMFRSYCLNRNETFGNMEINSDNFYLKNSSVISSILPLISFPVKHTYITDEALTTAIT